MDCFFVVFLQISFDDEIFVTLPLLQDLFTHLGGEWLKHGKRVEWMNEWMNDSLILLTSVLVMKLSLFHFYFKIFFTSNYEVKDWKNVWLLEWQLCNLPLNKFWRCNYLLILIITFLSSKNAKNYLDEWMNEWMVSWYSLQINYGHENSINKSTQQVGKNLVPNNIIINL